MSALHTAETPLKCLVVIPTYNEAENIRIVLQDLLELETPVDILVVDDGSPDGTGDLVASHPQFGKRVFLLRRPRKSGFARACKAGYQWGLQNGYDTCGTMDADRSHDPKDVPLLIAALQRGAEIAVGSRYLGGIRIINWPMRRLLLSWFAGVYARALCGIPMTDPTSGFKMMSRKALQSVDFSRCSADGYGFQLELHFFAWRAGCKLEEVPIVFTERKRGASKMSKWTAIEAMLTVPALGLRRLAASSRRSSSTS
jgi:dolichol-phosphate mannosyltransferase